MLTFSHVIETGRVSVMFTAKPDQRIRAMLKASGFRWAPAGGFWWRRRVEGFADFLAALDRALNPRRPDGACWDCGAADGFFRPYGAATPVYCDRCHKVHAAAHDKPRGLCPVCGKQVRITGRTTDGRLIGECEDAFTPERWLAPDNCAPMGGLDVDAMYEDACRDACGL